MTTPTPRLAIPNAVQVTALLDDGGQSAALVLGLKTDANLVLTKALLQEFLRAGWSALKPLMVSTVTITGGIARGTGGSYSNLVEYLDQPTGGAVGTATGARAVAGAAGLLKWSTANGTRSGKGRTFLPGLPASAVNADGRTYATAYRTTATTACADYVFATSQQAGIKPAVLSFATGASHQITSGTLAPVIGIQRRRMRG